MNSARKGSATQRVPKGRRGPSLMRRRVVLGSSRGRLFPRGRPGARPGLRQPSSGDSNGRLVATGFSPGIGHGSLRRDLVICPDRTAAISQGPLAQPLMDRTHGSRHTLDDEREPKASDHPTEWGKGILLPVWIAWAWGPRSLRRGNVSARRELSRRSSLPALRPTGTEGPAHSCEPSYMRAGDAWGNRACVRNGNDSSERCAQGRKGQVEGEGEG
jgi:hypothetical protein